MILTREERRTFRKLLFLYQDGLAITASIVALHTKGIFDFLGTNSQTTLEEISTSFTAIHKGYLNISLRSLASQGFLTYEVSDTIIQIGTTRKFFKLKQRIPDYITFETLYQMQLKLLKTPFSEFSLDHRYFEFSKMIKSLKIKHRDDTYFLEEVSYHLEGMLLMPVLVYLNYQADLEGIDIKKFIAEHDKLKQFFETLDLLSSKAFTKKGAFLLEKSYACGVTTSYLPIMSNITTYLSGDFTPFFERDEEGNEKQVFRSINVWGSGGSHATYFKKIEAIVTDIFNKPLQEQPKGIIDVGCGNGALLEHLFNLIWNDTNRRKDLDKNKLILIGADYNKEALLST